MRLTSRHREAGALAFAVMLSFPGFAAGAAPAAAAKPPKPTPHLEVFFVKGFQDPAWQQAAFKKVAGNWTASVPPAAGKKAVVVSAIGRDGKLTAARIDTASGSEAWDKAALDAVRKAAPFPPLPMTWAEPTVDVHWHFAFGH